MRYTICIKMAKKLHSVLCVNVRSPKYFFLFFISFTHTREDLHHHKGATYFFNHNTMWENVGNESTVLFSDTPSVLLLSWSGLWSSPHLHARPLSLLYYSNYVGYWYYCDCLLFYQLLTLNFMCLNILKNKLFLKYKYFSHAIKYSMHFSIKHCLHNSIEPHQCTVLYNMPKKKKKTIFLQEWINTFSFISYGKILFDMQPVYHKSKDLKWTSIEIPLQLFQPFCVFMYNIKTTVGWKQ